MDIALYDMDRTITKRGTFTPFLLFAAGRRAPWRLAAAPLWIGAMLAHKAGLVARKPLKQFGFRLFLGHALTKAEVQDLADAYALRTMADNVQPGAIAQIAQDRAEGRMLVMATAAPSFYAETIGQALGMDAVIATRHATMEDGGVSHHIDGENCYGRHKLAMVQAWLSENGHGSARMRFYSDDLSDAPTLDRADEAFVVNAGARLQKVAALRGWSCLVFR